MFPALIDQSGERRRPDDVDPSADQRKPVRLQIEHRRGVGDLAGEPGLDRVSVGRSNVKRLIGEAGAHVTGFKRALDRIGAQRRSEKADAARPQDQSQDQRSGQSAQRRRPAQTRAHRSDGSRFGNAGHGAHPLAQGVGGERTRRARADRITQGDEPGVFGGKLGVRREARLESDRARGVEFAIERGVNKGVASQVAHRPPPRLANSSARPRARRDITVPTGAPIAAAISR